MKTFYREEQSAIDTTYFSPSPRKPALVVAYWQQEFGSEIDISSFEPVTREQLYQVHAPAYVDGVLDGKLPNGFGDTNPKIIKVLPYVAGSMVAAAKYALLMRGITFSPTSGAHHACYAHGGGFCTFNFLVLAAVEAYKAGAQRIGIFDCDQHFGNGSVDIIRHLGINYIKHHSYAGKGLPWLETLQDRIIEFVKDLDLLIYNAGADCHIDDPLGGAFNTGQLLQRDNTILTAARMAGVPVAISLAGGYQDPIYPVLQVHAGTMLEAIKAEAFLG